MLWGWMLPENSFKQCKYKFIHCSFITHSTWIQLTQTELKTPPHDQEGADVMIDVQRRHLILLLSENKEDGLDKLHHPEAHRQPAIIHRIVTVFVLLDWQFWRASSDEAEFKSNLNVLHGAMCARHQERERTRGIEIIS